MVPSTESGCGSHAQDKATAGLCVVADLHLGSLLFDHVAFEKCMQMLCSYVQDNSIVVSHLVLVGETVDRAVSLPGQALRGLSNEWQVDLAAKVVLDLARRIRAGHVVVVGRRGEMRRGPSEQRRLAEKLLLAGTKASYSATELKLQLGSQRVVFTHALGRTSASYAGVLTPQILTEGLMKADRLGADLAVVGNYRRFAHSGSILSMPSFVLEPHSELYNERGVGIKKTDESAYLVRSDSGNQWSEVFWDGRRWKCQCSTGTYPEPACMHVFAVVFSRVLNPVSESGNSCPDCGSDDLIKKGTRNNKSSIAQRYLCKK